MLKIYPADSRGGADYGWLKTSYSFSFAEYYDPERMGFGALRVVNDDFIAPGAGFPTHPHQNMEIITFVVKGSLAHKDDTGGNGKTSYGEVQVMSAGTGVLHSEFNASDTEPAELFQIWIEPNQYHVHPRYQQGRIDLNKEESLLVGPKEKADLWIYQNAYITYVQKQEEQYTYQMNNEENGLFVLVIEGDVVIQNQKLGHRDAVEITNEKAITFNILSAAQILCIEVPM